MSNHHRPRRDRSHSDAAIYLESRLAASPVTVGVGADLSPSMTTFSPAKKGTGTNNTDNIQRPRSKSDSDSNHRVNGRSNMHYYKRIPSGKISHITAGYHHSNSHKVRRPVLAQRSKSNVLGKMWIRPFSNTTRLQVQGDAASRSKSSVSRLCPTGPLVIDKKSRQKDSLSTTGGMHHSLDFSSDHVFFDCAHPVPLRTPERPTAHVPSAAVVAFGESGKPISYYNAPPSPHQEMSGLRTIPGNYFLAHSLPLADSQWTGTMLSTTDDKRGPSHMTRISHPAWD